MTFKNKVVAITGAAGGVGQSLCRYFFDEGAKVAAIDKKASVESLAAELKADAKRFAHAVADVSEPHEVERAFAALTGALGPIDILVNNAGGSSHSTLARTDAAGWRHEIRLNVDSAYFCVQAVIPGMVARHSGVIINIGSVNGLSALGDPAYSAGKAAMISLTRSLAQEYGPYGVRANIVLPGTIRTPVWEKRAAKDPKVLETLKRWYPLGRIVEPIDIARAVGFLASDAASAITGVALPVDCGLMSGNIVMRQELTLEDL
ncbi:MAG: SDR family oxidoreductase [Hyphomicrobiales bacterium]|nr:SDR family oxidoreductase [Hyphomicrobiales bacterium]MBV9907920.1 SDR family oxidoreductase [Hyphomicrobiales bacterium]